MVQIDLYCSGEVVFFLFVFNVLDIEFVIYIVKDSIGVIFVDGELLEIISG